MAYCKNCGADAGEASFCPNCGTSTAQAPVAPATTPTPAPAPAPTYSYANSSASGDASSIGFAVLSAFFPIVGLVLFFVWKDQYPLKAKSCITGAIVGFILSVVVGCAYGAFMASMMSGMGYYY